MGNRRIMLIEDQPDDQLLTLRTLKKGRIHNVIVAHEGEEALKYLLQDTGVVLPKLILLDLRMPKVDGFEFLEEVRSHRHTRDIPVIVLSSSPWERDRERCRRLGADAYLTKPLDLMEFEAAMRKIDAKPTEIATQPLSTRRNGRQSLVSLIPPAKDTTTGVL